MDPADPATAALHNRNVRRTTLAPPVSPRPLKPAPPVAPRSPAPAPAAPATRTATPRTRTAAPVSPPVSPPVPRPVPGRTAPTRRPPSPPPGDPTTTTGGGRRRAALGAPAGAPPSPPAPANPTPPSRWRPHGSKRWYVALAATVGVLVLFASCSTFAYRLVKDELAGRDAQADAGESAAPAARDISSREVDPEPLTVEEVFPDEEIVIDPAEPPYVVLGTQESDDCTAAATDDLGALLGDVGCSQVVRATLRSPTDAYLITGGILNLETAADAEQAYDAIGPMIEDETGRFQGLLAGDGTEPIVTSETNVGWDFRGHFLVYVVIARADGGAFSGADERHAELILWDIAEVHLRTHALDPRTTASDPTQPPSPTAVPSEE